MALRKLLVECLLLTLTALCLVAIFEFGGIARSFASALLVFVLPGRAFLAAWFPDRLADAPGNILLTIILSIAVAVIGGLLLNLLPLGLQAQTWALWLAVITVINETVALLRTVHRREPIARGQGWGFQPLQAVALLMAGVIVVGALLVARTGAINQPRPGFTQLWLIPGDSPDSVQLGVENQEGADMSYWLVVRQGDTSIHDYYGIQVNEASTWNAILQLPSNADSIQQPIEADLYRSDQPTSVYRSVHLWLSDTGSK